MLEDRIAQGRQRLTGLLFPRAGTRVGRPGFPDRCQEETANSVSSAGPEKAIPASTHRPQDRNELQLSCRPFACTRAQDLVALPLKECSDHKDHPFHKSNSQTTEKKGQICLFQIGRRPCQRRWRSRRGSYHLGVRVLVSASIRLHDHVSFPTFPRVRPHLPFAAPFLYII